jgi:hypothetical protein
VPKADNGASHSNNSAARPDKGRGTVAPGALAVFIDVKLGFSGSLDRQVKGLVARDVRFVPKADISRFT